MDREGGEVDTIPRALFATGASCAANSSLRARVAAADAEAFLNTHLDGGRRERDAGTSPRMG